ncbi:hypothetical protein E2493_13885 [Sphingomonas parva]|uniref:Uncharacterized protein n=1 Tax=Sphingomonas parva TaxID=2555898 RepID=A0A4Y8ZNN1_9SPHN|nr:hypothetical protein [Sphingomonas parva]TFI57611.1 hypothetical protein E2493_13885 [Sphingomonas parva]
MNASATIPLRFQRGELESKAELSAAGLARLAEATSPERLVQSLAESGNLRDALYALVMVLPHRQTVWWACLAARILPDLDHRPADRAAVEAAERWVQSVAPADAEDAGEKAETAGLENGPAWVAMAAYWAGPSLAPRGQQPVPPAPHLAGVASRTALLLLSSDPAFNHRIAFTDWLPLGIALMRGENGRQAQAALRSRVAAA